MATASGPNTKMSQHQVNILYTIFDKFDKAAREANFPYVLAAGTALGAVRHGGVVPWDDDGDLYALEHHFRPAAMALFQAANMRGLHIKPHTFGGGLQSDSWYKVYLGDNSFPNVDIFLLTYKDDCWKHSDPRAAEWWPKEYLTTLELQTSSRVKFGPLNLPLFGSPANYMARVYGDDWATVRRSGWDHMNETFGKEDTRAVNDYRPALPTVLLP